MQLYQLSIINMTLFLMCLGGGGQRRIVTVSTTNIPKKRFVISEMNVINFK